MGIRDSAQGIGCSVGLDESCNGVAKLEDIRGIGLSLGSVCLYSSFATV